MVAVLAVMIMIVGCKKDDDKILNKVTISGNENTDSEYNGVYTPVGARYYAPAQLMCMTTMYSYQLYISLSPDAQIYIEVEVPNNDAGLPTGSYSFYTECQESFYASFFFNPAKALPDLYFSEGTLKITKSGDIYDIDTALTIHPDAGGGIFKYNFHGELTYIEPA